MTIKEQQFNELTNILLVNIYTQSKDKQEIVLKNFNPINKNHQLMFIISLGVNAIFGYPIKLEMGFFKFLKFKKKYKNLKFISRAKHVDVAAAIDVDYEINRIKNLNYLDVVFWDELISYVVKGE